MNPNLEKIMSLSKDTIISILPHDNPDVDAILSSVLLSKLLDFLGYKNKVVILDKKISQDTLYICNLVGVNPKDFMVNSLNKDSSIFIVDHYSCNYSDKIIGCIDHHPIAKIPKYYIYEFRNSCSTANIIYSFMLEIGMPITKEIVMLLGYAMLVDTSGFTSNKTVKEQAEKLPSLLKSFGLDYDTMRKESLLYTDIYNMEMHDIINNGAKVHTYSKGIVKSSYLQLENAIDKKAMLDILLEIKNELETSNLFDLWIYIIYSIENNKTICYYLKPNQVITQKKFNGILSRGNDIMPNIEKIYN